MDWISTDSYIRSILLNFTDIEDVIKKEDEAGYDQKAFEERLEIKGSSDHRKLIRMLEAVNDYPSLSVPLLEQYFDKET